MRKRNFQHMVFALSMLANMSCSTHALWDSTDPNEQIWIPASQITEEELVKRGVAYEVYSQEDCNGYLVEPGNLSKFKDYSLRTLCTPITLAVDAVTTVTVGGVMLIAGAAQADPQGFSEAVASLLNAAIN
jgi:hypothetical protein